LLAHRGALAPALDDLQIGATAGGLLAEIHGGEPGADSILVRTLSACSPNKSTTIKAKRGTTISRSLPIAPNHINGLRRTPMRQLSKISLMQRPNKRRKQTRAERHVIRRPIGTPVVIAASL